MKYSFLMPYKNRTAQLYNTLLSLLHHYGDRNDWEVVLVVDGENENVILPVGIGARVQRKNVKRDGVNPAPLFNEAARMANGEFLVITNPECYHITNVLAWYDSVFAKCVTAYAVAACYNVPRVCFLKGYRANLGPRTTVFQHSTDHNVLYHYCSAIQKDIYWKIGGFDDRFGAGYACEDDDFRDRVVCSGTPCVTDDSVIVLHQEHDKLKHTPEIKARYEHNLKLLRNGEKERGYKHDVNVFKRK